VSSNSRVLSQNYYTRHRLDAETLGDAWMVLGVLDVDNQIVLELPTIPPIPTNEEIRESAASYTRGVVEVRNNLTVSM